MAKLPKPNRTISSGSIISAIEIAYLRSFYKLEIENFNGLNIIFGENDTGKSNVMRALNLFFNNKIDEEYGFDFDIDFSARRLAESENGKAEGKDVRKFAYVKIWFRSPPEHKASLGESFYVKRSWNQWSQGDYNQEVSAHLKPSNKQQSLTRFLNKIKFTYIPAVKDRTVYGKLLVDAYNYISNTEAFSKALKNFTEEIRNQTGVLSDMISRSLNMESAIAPPSDLGELFSSLDFETLVAGGDRMSLIRQRGDGIQARHIPEIMAFIAERDTKPYHVWCIEEPENSLSINSAMVLAERIREIPKKDIIQIFITTHSPAFYCLDDKYIQKIFMKKDEGLVSTLEGGDLPPKKLMEFMGDGFYLPLVAESVKAAAQRADILNEELSKLKKQIQHQNRALLFVEGDTDEIIIRKNLLSVDKNAFDLIEIVSLGGASHAQKLSGLTESLLLRLIGSRRGYVLLDSDKAGREALPKLLSSQSARSGWVKSTNNLSLRLLPPTAEAQMAFQAAGIKELDLTGVCLEDCFPAELRKRAEKSGSYTLSEPREFVRSRGDMFAISSALVDDKFRFYLRAPSAECKKSFSSWLIESGEAEVDIIAELLKAMLLDISIR